MTFARLDRLTLSRLCELAVVLLLDRYFVRLIEAGAALAHIPLPEMPLLHHVYLLLTMTILVLLWARYRGETLADLGLVKQTSWPRIIGQGLLIFAAAMLYDIAARPFVDPFIASLTHTSPTLAEQHFAPLKGNLGLLLYLIPCAWIFGGFGEELLFRGFIMTRIAQILGSSRAAWIAAVFLQAVPFALGHGYQGPVGMIAVYVSGVITGAGTLLWRRSLWPAIIAHGVQDTFAFAAFYAGIAHG